MCRSVIAFVNNDFQTMVSHILQKETKQEVQSRFNVVIYNTILYAAQQIRSDLEIRAEIPHNHAASLWVLLRNRPCLDRTSFSTLLTCAGLLCCNFFGQPGSVSKFPPFVWVKLWVGWVGRGYTEISRYFPASWINWVTLVTKIKLLYSLRF